MNEEALKLYSPIPEGFKLVKRKGYDGSSPYHYFIRNKKMAKSKKREPVKKASKPEPTKKKLGQDEWDEQEGGGGDFIKLPTGRHLARIRSVISLGQVVFSFDGKKDQKATSAMGFVLEVYAFKEGKKGIVIKSPEPAIVYHVMKAHKDNDKSHYTKMMKSFKTKSPADLAKSACGVELYTSDKGYMYVRGGMYPVGFSERKAIPKLTKKGFTVPNLDRMTIEAMKELNSITQVKDYVLEAVNYSGSAAEKVVIKIRKDKPEYAKLSNKKGKDSKGKEKKKGKKPKKLSEKKEY